MMGTITNAISWSGSGVTLSMFVVSECDASLDPATMSLEPAPTRTRTYILEDEDNVLPGRLVTEYDLCFNEVPPSLDALLARCLDAARAAGARVAWFGFEGSFDFGFLLVAEVANLIYAVVDSEGMAIASDLTLSTQTWTERVVRAGERARGVI